MFCTNKLAEPKFLYFRLLIKLYRMKKSLYSLLLILSFGGVFAQDPHLTQWYMAPLYLNPAMTGAFDGNFRFAGLFRGQWGAVLENESVPMYRTYTFSADFRTNKGFAKGDAFGFGASFLSDQAGDANFGYDVFQLGIAYHKSLNRKATNFLALGFSSQIFDQTLNPAALQFGSQWDSQIGAFNPALPSNETITARVFYWDVDAGLLWYMKLGRRSDVYLGAAMFHINQPNISMLGDKAVDLNTKYVAHGGIRFPLGGRFDLQPKFIFLYQGKSIENMLAADFRILMDERDPQGANFRIGAMMRLVGGDPSAPWQGEAISPESVSLTAGVDWLGFSLGIAYDFTVSELITGDESRGGFEIGLTYIGKWNKRKPQTIYCPKF